MADVGPQEEESPGKMIAALSVLPKLMALQDKQLCSMIAQDVVVHLDILALKPELGILQPTTILAFHSSCSSVGGHGGVFSTLKTMFFK